MVKFLQILSQKYQHPFSWKYFATSHGKGVVAGVGERAKSLVRQKVTSKGGDRIILQSSKDFANAAMQLLHKTKVFHISQEEIAAKLNDIVNWDDTKATPLGLRKNNIHILQCADGISFISHTCNK